MYIPAHFDESRIGALHNFIRQYPFGMLVTHGPEGLDANHIPFHLKADSGRHGILHAHVARANSVWREVADGDDVLVVFRAGNAYISPNWYPSKHEFHKQVPTWNYMVVHAHGRITVHEDARFTRSVVAHLTRTHEAMEPAPWKMTDSAPNFIDGMLEKIVGIEIEIMRLDGKFKLSQNREGRDREGAGHALKVRGELVIGEAMLRAGEGKTG